MLENKKAQMEYSEASNAKLTQFIIIALVIFVLGFVFGHQVTASGVFESPNAVEQTVEDDVPDEEAREDK